MDSSLLGGVQNKKKTFRRRKILLHASEGRILRFFRLFLRFSSFFHPFLFSFWKLSFEALLRRTRLEVPSTGNCKKCPVTLSPRLAGGKCLLPPALDPRAGTRGEREEWTDRFSQKTLVFWVL